ncbi:ectoine/hydroxyectoine ABC transporter substrate-binding protein EhuB [Bordetella genomosp. 7]|uniref:Ectoine/hydroxyectoine ABC transporter substrate-binding protein EhuB n=1 Tax=Bordetella genomosp. 7 TaxID=1416805 RepID=A0A261RHH1_9BORD|nr:MULTISPECIES: ectoine/hydroxyectoine ABC transporter substrate-binding protein EhuB [Bordetella]OZI24469.1 ectoine/hydroxyectoine ABC transporter substrate-binding protein EhuB [Bordetella genomosp. 7]OZI28511.1 ectoine/hydroxyectoine ABC transporter substrate-binding protein EhuB [Bordetella genomosp. 7]
MISKLASKAACLAIATTLLGSTAWADTKDDILESKTVTIGIHNRQPWGFRAEDGSAAGFHPDLIRAAFERLGVKQVDFVITEFGALIPGLNAGRFDMVASGIAITPERCKVVVFSEPDLAVGDSLIVKKGNPLKLHSYADIVANAKVRLAGGRGTLNTRNAIDAGVPTSQITYLGDAQAMLSALLADRVDAATLSAPSVVGLLQDPKLQGVERAQPFTGLVRNGVPAMMYTAIAFRSDDTALRDAYDEQLRALKADGTVDKLRAKYGFTDDDKVDPAVTTQKVCAGEF